MIEVIARRAIDVAARRAAGEHVPVPATMTRGRHPMSHACTLKRERHRPTRSSSTPGRTLLTVLRGELGLTGAKEGCDDSECGACMVLVDGRPVNSCSYLALQADGREITTVEGLANGGELHPLQAAFLDEGGVQCGFCTPGMLISAEALLARNPDPSEEEVRLALGGQPVPLHRLPEDRARPCSPPRRALRARPTASRVSR